MLSRSDVRYNCYRMKKNKPDAKVLEVAALVEPLLDASQTWDKFATEWDIMVSLKGEIVIIKPELDEKFIHETCLEKKMLAKKGLTDEDFSDRQHNIVNTVESIMLDRIMTWENYNSVWGTKVNKELFLIETFMRNTNTGQKPVTEEMIKGSMQAFPVADNPERENKPSVQMGEFTNMTPEEIEKFQAVLQMMKNKG